MRRKTDFYSQEEKSLETVNIIMEKHMDLFRQDKVRQEVIAQKQAEMKAKTDKALPNQVITEGAGATIEEIDDDEAKKLELQELFNKQ